MAETVIVPGMTMIPGDLQGTLFDVEKSNWVEMNDLDGHSYWKTKKVVPEMYSGDYAEYHLIGIKSIISRDPGNVGGDECFDDVDESLHNIMFSGKIEWYDKDESLGRTAGNRVGVMIRFPESVTEDQLNTVRFHIAGKVYDKSVLDEHEGKKVLWYYPLVKGSEDQFQVKVEWTPTMYEIFNIMISPTSVLLEKPVESTTKA